MKVRALLEKHFKDMQDLEFTVEDNRLYMLQTRNGKRTGLAAVRIAVEMVERKTDHERGRDQTHPGRFVRPAARADLRSQIDRARRRRSASGLARRSGRGFRSRCFQRRGSGAARPSRRESGARAHRNFARKTCAA